MKSFSNQIRGYLLANNYQLLLYYCLAAILSSCCLCCLMSPVFACMKVFVFVSVPQLMSSSLFFTSKFFFIVGNLIVIFLVGECKSKTKTKNDLGFFTVDDQYSSCCCGGRMCYGDNECDLEPKSEKFLEVSRDIVSGEPKQGWVEEEKVDVNRRAEDFIARINMWRLREAAQDLIGLSQ